MDPDLPDDDLSSGDDPWARPDDLEVFRPPPPPDDRLWRHPSELAPAAPDRPDGSLRSQPMAMAVLAGLVGSLMTAGIVAATGGLTDRVEVVEREQVPVTPAALAATSAPSGVVEIAEAVRPSIVRIEVQAMGGSGSGSGVIFRDVGYVLTNAHVVVGADRVNVVLSDGRERIAELIGADEETDIAVLRMDDGPYTPAVLGSATDLQVGEAAIAIGSPLGLRGGPSVTVGVISAIGRRVDNAGGRPLLDMIQTDAPIAPGSSGGALLDGSGAVIGVTTAIAVSDVGAEGLGFATPIDVARAVADDLIEDGVVSRAWLGIEGLDLAAADAVDLELRGGALVQAVMGASPADQAGLEPGDVIIGLDDAPIESMSGLVVALRTRRPGDQIDLDVVRADERLRMQTQLVERPSGVE